jgi:hypothetical protein
MVALTDSCLEARSSSIRRRHVQCGVEEEECSASVAMLLPLDGQSVITPPSLGERLSGVNLNGDVLESEASSPSSEQLQIIDDEKNFTSVLLARVHFSPSAQWQFRRPHLASRIERWGLRDVGFNYNIVAVFGSQSTGKSRLITHGLHV